MLNLQLQEMFFPWIAMATGQNLKYDDVLLEANDENSIQYQIVQYWEDEGWINDQVYKLVAATTNYWP